MTNNEAIMILESIQPSCGEKYVFSESKRYEAIDMAINALTAQPETHACDCVSRKAAINEALKCRVIEVTPAHMLIDKTEMVTKLLALPSVQPDLSSYSDKLWRNAYERGKAEAEAEIVRCKDCKYWREHKYAKETKKYIPFCGFNAIYTKADDFCSRAERREDG